MIPLSGFRAAVAEDLPELLRRRFGLELRREIDDGDRRRRHAERIAVEAAGQIGNDQGEGLGRAGRRRDDVHRGRPGAPEILVGQIEDALVVRIGVNRRHHPLLDAERLVDDHDRRGQAVGRAGGVGDDMMLLRLIALVVDPHHDRQVLLLGGGGDDHLLGAGLEVGGGLRTGQEQAGALDHDIDPLVVPGNGTRDRGRPGS